jgi:hypothetical protein
MSEREPLPEHSDSPHEPGRWMTETCERCRRQSIGQRAFLYMLLSDRDFARLYPDKPNLRG